MNNTLKPMFYQTLILFANILTGVVITRSSNYVVRADISSLTAWLGFSLIILNQSHLENIIRRKINFARNDYFLRTIPILIFSCFTTIALGISSWIFPLVFFYMFLNTIVQFRGAKFFVSNGNVSFLIFSLFFYIVNLILTSVLILFNFLNIYTWLFTSIVADLILLILYMFFSKVSEPIFFRTTHENHVKFSIAAVFFALADPVVVMIANHFSNAEGLAYFVVAISTVSPILIVYSAFQNSLLAFPNKVKLNFKYLKVLSFIFLLISSATSYTFLIKYAIPIVFGERYSQLTSHTVLIVAMGYLMFAFKISNTIMRSLDHIFYSVSLTLTFLISFAFCCVYVSESKVSLILSTVMSLSVSLAMLGIGLIINAAFKQFHIDRNI
jgi:hypothetical protein